MRKEEEDDDDADADDKHDHDIETFSCIYFIIQCWWLSLWWHINIDDYWKELDETGKTVLIGFDCIEVEKLN